MTPLNEEQMHAEHQDAQVKHARWLAEIDEWRAEHARAIETLNQALNFIRMHEADLEDHAAAIQEHEGKVGDHEKVLGDDAHGEEMTAEHVRLEARHEEVMRQHNRYRGRHRALIDEVMQLAVVMHKVSHQPAP